MVVNGRNKKGFFTCRALVQSCDTCLTSSIQIKCQCVSAHTCTCHKLLSFPFTFLFSSPFFGFVCVNNWFTGTEFNQYYLIITRSCGVGEMRHPVYLTCLLLVVVTTPLYILHVLNAEGLGLTPSGLMSWLPLAPALLICWCGSLYLDTMHL